MGDRSELIGIFPGLKTTTFTITSEQTKRYNCVAWACDDKWRTHPVGRFWSHVEGYYWPEGVPRGSSVAHYERALATEGFTRCSNGTFEPGIEKIAIYALGDQFRHVARQVGDGRWTSKLGSHCDIEHDLDAIAGLTTDPHDSYGDVVRFMQRTAQE